MMSKKCKYAFKAMICLGKNYNKGYLQTADIVIAERIPRKFLEQILLELKNAGMIGSKQGVKGGYFLNRKPSKITVADIYRLFDGAIALLPCVSLNFYKKCDDCMDEKTCRLRKQFIKIREGARIIMSRTSLEDIIKHPENQSIKNKN